MPLHDTLRTIITDYSNAKNGPFANHPLATFIRQEAAKTVEAALGELGAGLLVEGSAGAGNWAAVPWISVFDPAITTSATHGYYVVYLFHVSGPVVHLSLNQGTTAVREEFGPRAREILQDRADLMRKRIAELADALPVTKIDLGSSARLPGDYAAGHALGITYELTTLPDETKLRVDLQNIVRAYRALTYRGGIDADVDSQSDLAEEFGIPAGASVTETRKYVYHRKIERNRTAARQAKKFHGTRCQACALDFGERYGEIGEGFIEAHHLRPIATLEEGVPVKYDVAADFAVLCSNCHRMIHRFSDPSDVVKFRALILALTAKVGMEMYSDVKPSAWLAKTVPGYGFWSDPEKEAIHDFSLLWSLYEGTILNTKGNANSIIHATRPLKDHGKLVLEPCRSAIEYFMHRYFGGIAFTDTFHELRFRSNDHRKLVEKVLRGEPSDDAEVLAAILIIIFRLRNNLFHGVKWIAGFRGQLENFRHANNVLMAVMDMYEESMMLR